MVEDDHSIREVLEIVLSAENYEVQAFSTVSEFTQRNAKIEPDLYIFDVMLPDGSGIDLCKEIKKNSQNNNVPVIIMSAHAHLQEISEICKPDFFIPKPFDIDQLLQKVQQVIELK